MHKKAIIIMLAISMLAGCGKIKEKKSAQKDAVMSESASSLKDSEAEEENAAAEKVKIRISNRFSESSPFETALGDDEAKEIAAQLEEFESRSTTPELVPENGYLSVYVGGENSGLYFYCGDGIWAYSSEQTGKKLILPDDLEASEMLADKLCFYTVMPTLLSSDEEEDTEFEADFDQISDSSVMLSDTSVHNEEVLFFYVDDRTTRVYSYTIGDEGIYYYQGTDERTDAEINGVPYHQSLDEYEYFGNSEEAYCRHEMYDVFYVADDFEGEFRPELFAQRIADNYEFAYSFSARADGSDFVCEVFRKDDETAYVLLDEDGGIFAAWFLSGDGIKLMNGMNVYQSGLGLDELLEHAREHRDDIVAEKESKKDYTAVQWREDDLERLGLFDLHDIDEGSEISETGVVQDYIDYLSSGKPYAFEYWSIGDFRYDYFLLTDNGTDCYMYEDISSHNNSFDYDMEQIYVGDYVYYSDDDGSYSKYARSEQKGNEAGYRLPDVFFKPEDMTFSRAYTGTVCGEEYEIEEWSFGNDTATFFCRDGEIVAFKYMVFGKSRYFYITRYEKSADEQYIAVPSDSREVRD